MLGWRLGISAVLVPALLGLFYWDSATGTGAPVLLLFSLFLTIRATFEMVHLLRTRNMQPSFELCAVCNVAIVLAAWGHVQLQSTPDGNMGLLVSLGLICSAVVAAFLLLMIFEGARYRKPGSSLESLGANMITVIYAGCLIAVIAQFRWFPSESIGYFAIGSVIIAAKSGDIMAYTFGRLWGKKKMIPLLSPGKTWMGGFGALVGSCLGGWLWLTYGGALFSGAPKAAELSCVLGYCLTMGVIGLIGDLCESLIKRDAEKKDSAQLMPGFGGLLDLLDSPLFAGPVALAWWVLWPPAIA